MTLTVHHMHVSQSERVVWLCEELGIPYELVLHTRDPVFSPQSIKDLHPMGQSPIIQDISSSNSSDDGGETLTLAETAACVQYIIHKHGNGRFTLPPEHKNYADYLYWLHLSSGNLQPTTSFLLLCPDNESSAERREMMKGRLTKILTMMNSRLANNTWLAGEEFTLADMMMVYSLTTGRVFLPIDLNPYPAILAYLSRAVQRPGYQSARAKADPSLELMIQGPPPTSFFARLEAAKAKQ